MGHFSNDFKIKKGYTFNLEGERDPLTNRSEADLLEEHSSQSNETISKVVRGFVLDGLSKSKYLFSKDPKIDHYVPGNNEDIPIGEPSILDNWEKWKKYLENCDKEDFFKVLKALTDRKNQALDIMNQRDLKRDEEPIRYKPDLHATARAVPMGET